MVRIATCRTPGCSNEGIPIEMESPAGTTIVCGVCGQIIRDVAGEDDGSDVEVPPWLI